MYYLHHPRGKEKMLDYYDSGYLCRYLPEQYLFVKNLKRRKILGQLDFTHMEDKPNYYRRLSDKLIRNSFFMASFREIGCSPQNERVISMKLPRAIFKRRTIVLGTLNDLFSRYSITERNINIFSKIILLTKNLIIYIIELTIAILYNFSKTFEKTKLKKKAKTIKKVL